MPLYTIENMAPLFWALDQTRGIMQNPEHHPEGEVFEHSVQCMIHAFRETDDPDLILAAMLHDVGKTGMSNGHEKISVEMLSCHCSEKTLWLIENHMRFWYYVMGQMRKMSKAKILCEHPWFNDLVKLARFDKLGRRPRPNRKIFSEEKVVEDLNKAYGRYQAANSLNRRCSSAGRAADL